MHSSPNPKILVLIVTCSFLICTCIFGQKKASVEVDIAKCWGYPLGGAAGEQIISDGGRIFIGSGGGKIEALSLDGKRTGSSEFGGGISSNIIATDGGLFFVTSAISTNGSKSGDSKLRSVTTETGITNWAVKLPDAEEYYISNFKGNIIVVSKTGALQSIDAKQGGVMWKQEIAKSITAKPEFTATGVIVATTGNQIFNVSMETGQIDSMRKTAFGITAITVIEKEVLIAGDERGNIVSLKGADKPLWSFKTGGSMSGLIAVGDHILAASHDNFVYFLAGRNGSRVWKKRLSGRVFNVANIMDQYALLSGFQEGGAMLIYLESGRVAGQIIFDDEESIASAPSVISRGGPIIVLTNKAAYAFSLSGPTGCIK